MMHREIKLMEKFTEMTYLLEFFSLMVLVIKEMIQTYYDYWAL